MRETTNVTKIRKVEPDCLQSCKKTHPSELGYFFEKWQKNSRFGPFRSKNAIIATHFGSSTQQWTEGGRLQLGFLPFLFIFRVEYVLDEMKAMLLRIQKYYVMQSELKNTEYFLQVAFDWSKPFSFYNFQNIYAAVSLNFSVWNNWFFCEDSIVLEQKWFGPNIS